MADQHKEEEKKESLMEKIADKIYGHHSTSSTDCEDEKSSPLKAKIYRLFGREKPLHKVLGAGKPADVFLWRDKKVSAGVLGGATTIWALFNVLEYNFLTLVCHSLILGLAILFVASNASTFIKKAPLHIPEVNIPEDIVMKLASDLRKELNQAFATLREIASGKDLKKFISVIVGLWVLSVIGSCCDFLTLLYTIMLVLFTVPLFYEKYENQIDSFSEKAMVELKKQYAVFDAKVLSKIPRGPLKGKKID